MPILRKEDLPFVGSSFHFIGTHHDNVGISMYLVEAQPGRGVQLHCHEYDEIMVLQEGHGRLVLGDEIREVTGGNIVIIKAHTPHGFLNIGEGILRQTDIHVSPFFRQENLPPTEVSQAAGLPEVPPSITEHR
jgi:mannose-6-phosphate isomerase-like protein (cupin superfamily)